MIHSDHRSPSSARRLAGPPRLTLASASPRRRDILARLGVDFQTMAPDIEEDLSPLRPRRTCADNAARKHRWCRARLPDHWIVSADTVVEFQGRAMHKPAHREEACAFFRLFSGHRHRVLTALALSGPGTEATVTVTASHVVFRTLTESDIQGYFAQVDPLDKAGAYDIDQHADWIVAGYRGSYTNIMGLPVETLRPWLEQEGLLACGRRGARNRRKGAK